MRALTDDERKIVEENHNLIYGVASKFKLNVDDWYDILAIELCKAVIHHDPSRGKLSTYYYLRATSKIINEFAKQKTQKRQHEGFEPLEFLDNVETENNLDSTEITEAYLKDWFSNDEYGDILKLKIQGYTNGEIARTLQLKPYEIRKRLTVAREDYEKIYR